MSVFRKHVIIVDDSVRFALYAWRHLTGRIGFGTAEQSTDPEASVDPWIRNGTCLLSSDLELAIWWIRADADWRATWSEVRGLVGPEACDSGRVYTLLDVRAPGYSLSDALEVVGCGRTTWVVSAYVVAYQGVERVYPKSVDTLDALRRELVREPPGSRAPAGLVQVLVTGAGFEFRDRLGGFGVRDTHTLLEFVPKGATSALEGLVARPLTLADGERRPYLCLGVPRLDGSWADTPALRKLEEASRARDLDNWWQSLLTAVGERIEGRESDPGRWDGLKLQAEVRLRSAFREQLAADDWGLLDQAQDAARSGVELWLSTNYTLFADRAVRGSGGDWSVVASVSEAVDLANREFSPLAPALDRLRSRRLYKLHGDIGRLDTMALARTDKSPKSALQVETRNVVEAYKTAGHDLLHRARHCEAMVVHVVGHSLLDAPLRHLLDAGLSALGEDKPLLVMVSDPFAPNDASDLAGRVEQLLEHRAGPTRVARYWHPAGRYMAMLRRWFVPEMSGPGTWRERFDAGVLAMSISPQRGDAESWSPNPPSVGAWADRVVRAL